MTAARSKLESSSCGWFVRNPNNSHRPARLFCFPHAGGNANAYAEWLKSAPRGFDVWVAELPGRGRRAKETPIPDMKKLATAIADAIEQHLDRPYALLGHSMGSWVSYEVCRLLEARGVRQPRILYVSAIRAPHCPMRVGPFHAMEDDRLIREVQKMGGTPPGVLEDEDLAKRYILPTLKADYSVIETHHADPDPIRTPIVAFGGHEDPQIEKREIQEWRSRTTAEFDTRWYSGDHFFLHQRKREVAREIAVRFQKAA